MSTPMVRGVPLEVFSEPIASGLGAYSEMTRGTVTFEDIPKAATLEPANDGMHYTAHSSTAVRHLGEVVGRLEVLALAPNEGTGQEDLYSLWKLRTTTLKNAVRSPAVVPVPRGDVHSEAYLTLAATWVDEPDRKPVAFAGTLDLLTLRGNTIVKAATLGENAADYTGSMVHSVKLRTSHPVATLTVGYSGAKDAERFGDPGAVFNSSEHIQIAGFLAISSRISREHLRVLKALRASVPVLSSVAK